MSPGRHRATVSLGVVLMPSSSIQSLTGLLACLRQSRCSSCPPSTPRGSVPAFRNPTACGRAVSIRMCSHCCSRVNSSLCPFEMGHCCRSGFIESLSSGCVLIQTFETVFSYKPLQAETICV
ncbi:unnamed protein product [Protopolystoma xenopodis]|uniref:Uncharacterized protein n=1 Tax=Protopolystoma xenopodis TaxID=117903 RepID=A0A3S5BX86_9PLAT|nr:unnamed protein product [Protopolystoma xenopodis]